MKVRNVSNACPRVKQQARHEWELDRTILETIFAAESPDNLQASLTTNVFEDSRYRQLPKYRQLACEAYARGVLDALATLRAPQLASVQPPPVALVRTAPRVSAKRNSSAPAAPQTYQANPTAKVYDLPGWLTNAGRSVSVPATSTMQVDLPLTGTNG